MALVALGLWVTGQASEAGCGLAMWAVPTAAEAAAGKDTGRMLNQLPSDLTAFALPVRAATVDYHPTGWP